MFRESLFSRFRRSDMGEPKVQMDTDMAIALCLLADETVKRRKAG